MVACVFMVYHTFKRFADPYIFKRASKLQPSIYFTFPCRTIDTSCFEWRFLHQKTEKTSSFKMTPSFIMLLQYSRRYTECSGLRIVNFSNGLASLVDLNDLIGLEPFSRPIRLLSLNRSPIQPRNFSISPLSPVSRGCSRLETIKGSERYSRLIRR